MVRAFTEQIHHTCTHPPFLLEENSNTLTQPSISLTDILLEKNQKLNYKTMAMWWCGGVELPLWRSAL